MSWAYSLAPHEAEDLVQQAYVLILEGRAKFSRQASLRTWLFGVIKNLARKSRRTRLLRAGLLQKFWHPYAITEDVQSGSDNTLNAAILALSRKQREVIELHTYRGFSLEECAFIMRISVGSARTHYHRAKQSLAAALNQDSEQHSEQEGLQDD